MIAIGGVIVCTGHAQIISAYKKLIVVKGTGLFLGTASDLQHGGPAGLLLGYCIMSTLLYSVMVGAETADHYEYLLTFK